MMKLHMAVLQSQRKKSTVRRNKVSLRGSDKQELMMCSEVGSAVAASSGCFWARKLYMWGIAGPQKEYYRPTQAWPIFWARYSRYSLVRALMQGVSVWPPSDGSTQTLDLLRKGALKMMELPRPVPGPRTPLVFLGLTCSPFRDTKLSSGNSKRPQELAMKSFRNTKCPILRLTARTPPSSSPHLLTLDSSTLLSSTGPATPITATSGYLSAGTSARNFLTAYQKLSCSLT